MSRPTDDNQRPEHGFPRVSGDEPRVEGEREVTERFSPRERG